MSPGIIRKKIARLVWIYDGWKFSFEFHNFENFGNFCVLLLKQFFCVICGNSLTIIFFSFSYALFLYLQRKKRSSKDGKNPPIMALFQTKIKHIKKFQKCKFLPILRCNAPCLLFTEFWAQKQFKPIAHISITNIYYFMQFYLVFI